MGNDIKNTQSELKKKIREIKTKEIQNISDIYNGNNSNGWFFFSVYFISATGVLIKKIEEEYSQNSKKGTSFQSFIYVPLIFLFRHTLELILKFVYVSQTKNVSKDNINTHDLTDIFDKIKKVKISSKENIDIYSKKYPSLKKGDISKKIDLTKGYLEYLSNKYWLQTDFILTMFDSKSNLPTFSIFDSQNELFKYPIANKVQVVFNPLEMCKLDEDLISSLKDDFNKLSEVLNVFAIIG